MDDAALVGHLHRAGQRLNELGGPTRSRRTLGNPLLETAAFHELQRKIGPTFVLARLVNLHDVGMKQLGNGFRLGAKPRQADLANMRSSQDHLQSDEALQATMSRLVNDAHAAPPELFQDVITRHSHTLQRGRADDRFVRVVAPERRTDRAAMQPTDGNHGPAG